MNFELRGYFDSNFGDDYMQKIAAYYMPEHNFYIDNRNMVSPLATEEKNVALKPQTELLSLPKLTVTGSGFMVNSLRVLRYEAVWFLRERKKSHYCIGCNIEPFSNKFYEWLMAQKLKQFKFVICRDKKSLSWLKKHCPKLNSVYMPDILFAMPKEWLAQKTNEKKLGIALMHRAGDEENIEYYRAMAKIADYWVENKKSNVVLMAFDTGEEDDVFACECVKRLMKHSDMAEIATHGHSGEILNAYGECEKVVGARFHSAVLAMKTDTDLYPIIYREKMRNLLDDTNYPIKGCDIANIDIQSIKEFLIGKKNDFALDKSFEVEAEKIFSMLKDEWRDELR